VKKINRVTISIFRVQEGNGIETE